MDITKGHCGVFAALQRIINHLRAVFFFFCDDGVWVKISVVRLGKCVSCNLPHNSALSMEACD